MVARKAWYSPNFWLLALLGTLWLDDCSILMVLSYVMATQGHCMVAFVGCSILLVLSCVTGYSYIFGTLFSIGCFAIFGTLAGDGYSR